MKAIEAAMKTKTNILSWIMLQGWNLYSMMQNLREKKISGKIQKVQVK